MKRAYAKRGVRHKPKPSERRAAPRRRGAGAGRTGLGGRRLGVWQGGAPARRAGTPRAAIRARGADDVGVLDVRPGREYPVLLGAGSQAECPQAGRGARTVVEIADELPASAWTALSARRGGGAVGIRVRGDPRVGHPAPQAGAAVLAAHSPVTGTRARAEVLQLQRRRRDDAVDAGSGGLHAVPGGGVPGRQQGLPGDDAVRDAVVGRVASSHDAGGPGPPVRDAGAEAASKKLRSRRWIGRCDSCRRCWTSLS